MASVGISPQTTITLDSNGDGQCSLTAPSGTRWDLNLASISTTSVTNFAQGFLYLGNATGPIQLVDSTYNGNSASSGKVGGAPIFPGSYLWAVWSGGDAGASATLQVFGNQVTNYRAGGR